jgi:hypothetical protein
VMPGNRRRNSATADSSPCCSNAVRIAAASASVTCRQDGDGGSDRQATYSGCAVHSLGPGTHHLGASDMTQREVEIVVGMVFAFIVIMLLLSAWPAAPVRELLGVWVIAAMSLALWRILIRDDE